MLLVKDIMTQDLITLSPEDSLLLARKTMDEQRIRHIPVVTKTQKFIGLLSQRDILGAAISRLANLDEQERAEIEAQVPIGEIMQTEVLTVPSSYPLRKAGELLLAHKFGCLPVLEQSVLKGILTEADFVRLSLSLLP